MQKKHYKKPDGKYTENQIEYIEAWRDLSRPFCEIFDFELQGFDPSFLMKDKNNEVLQISPNLMKKFYNELTKNS